MHPLLERGAFWITERLGDGIDLLLVLEQRLGALCLIPLLPVELAELDPEEDVSGRDLERLLVRGDGTIGLLLRRICSPDDEVHLADITHALEQLVVERERLLRTTRGGVNITQRDRRADLRARDRLAPGDGGEHGLGLRELPLQVERLGFDHRLLLHGGTWAEDDRFPILLGGRFTACGLPRSRRSRVGLGRILRGRGAALI